MPNVSSAVFWTWKLPPPWGDYCAQSFSYLEFISELGMSSRGINVASSHYAEFNTIDTSSMIQNLRTRFSAVALSLLTLATIVFAWNNVQKQREFLLPQRWRQPQDRGTRFLLEFPGGGK